MVGGADAKFGYTAGEPMTLSETSIWRVSKGTAKADGSEVTIFSLDVKACTEEQVGNHARF